MSKNTEQVATNIAEHIEAVRREHRLVLTRDKRTGHWAQQTASAASQFRKMEKQLLHWGQQTIQSAINAGEHLTAVKKLAGHGKWLPFLKENLPSLSAETAQRYMRLAKASHVTDLTKCQTLTQAYIKCRILKAKPATKTADKLAEMSVVLNEGEGEAANSGHDGPSPLEKMTWKRWLAPVAFQERPL
jgi:hypothetical protein